MAAHLLRPAWVRHSLMPAFAVKSYEKCEHEWYRRDERHDGAGGAATNRGASVVSGDVSFEQARWALYEAALSGACGSPAAAMEAHKVQFAAAVATHVRLLQGAGVQVRIFHWTHCAQLSQRFISWSSTARLPPADNSHHRHTSGRVRVRV
jgi:hypothetical protein